MGKRSNFERRPQDKYETPRAAVMPLIDHLYPTTSFAEPCAGEGKLIKHLEKFGHICLEQSDIEVDARNIRKTMASCFITNPPWSRKVMHGIIDNLAGIRPTWLLMDADWMHTKQSGPYMKYCKKVVSVGRVKWIPGSKNTGKDNCSWYLFDKRMEIWPYPFDLFMQTKFYGRAE